ncbi:MAG: diphosphomevalonate decarboxylase, partial [Deltaproteobacteria bacterium]|nr:diphosphomevalonate decarboxylase [Deltaproteobacteria bacterium]
LAAAACWAAGLNPPARELSILARRNSGSACRSIEGGFCEWLKGSAEDGSDSYAVQVAPETHWPDMRMVVAVCSDAAKKISSREAMRRTVETSPYYPAWTACAERDLADARGALLSKDLSRLGAAAERNAWRMHASAMAADPPISYLRPTTVAVIAAVEELRASGVEAWFTLDAGPNPCVICLAPHVERVTMRLRGIAGVTRTVAGGPGAGVQRVEGA